MKGFLLFLLAIALGGALLYDSFVEPSESVSVPTENPAREMERITDMKQYEYEQQLQVELDRREQLWWELTQDIYGEPDPWER